MKKALIALVLLALSLSAAADDATTAANIISDVLCKVLFILFIIAPGVGAIIITLEGIRWAASSDDPGARKKSKEGIIHAIVGLIIVLLAVPLVTIVITGAGQFYSCVNYTSGTATGNAGSYTPGPPIMSGDNFLTTLKLQEGWNLISTPFVLNDSNVSLVFSDVKYDIVYSWDEASQSWLYYIPDYGGNLTRVEVDRGYWVHVKRNSTLLLFGKAPYPVRNVSLVAGWNLVGFSGYYPRSLGGSLEEVDYLYVYAWNSSQAFANPNGVGWSYDSPLGLSISKVPPTPPIMREAGYAGMTRLDSMEQGRGYWIYVTRNMSWVYDTDYPT